MYVRTPQSFARFKFAGLGQTSPVVSSIAQAIVQMEGTNPNFAANNNPGNLIYIGPNQNGQMGVVPGAGGFAQFPSQDSGMSALYNQIQSQINKGQNLTQFFNQYAPPNTSNAAGGVQTSAATQNYINFVSQQTGIDPSTPLNQVQAGAYSGSSDSSDDSSGLDLSSYVPGLDSIIPASIADSSVQLGGVVLSGSDLFTIGLAMAGVLVLSSIL